MPNGAHATARVLRSFRQVDVFSALPYLGNPLAVVLDGAGLETAAMQAFTHWTNLSEATFVLPPSRPEADYRVRIFCPGRELPFAGHPTLGTCHAWLEHGGVPRTSGRIVQECGIGLVTLRQDGTRLSFAAPPLRRSGPLDPEHLALIARGLGIMQADIVAHAWCDNGPGWRGLLLRSAELVLAVTPDPVILAGLDIGIAGPTRKRGAIGTATPATGAASEGEDHDFEVRAFFPGNQGLAEDPVTGSLNAALATWLMGAGLAPDHYVARQGTVLGRAGRIYLERGVDGEVWVGGDSVTCIQGEVFC
jgi:PhzF family phenazine biosynthesis protein